LWSAPKLASAEGLREDNSAASETTVQEARLPEAVLKMTGR
jgi:hypothetical protein